MLQRIGLIGLGVLVGILYWPAEALMHSLLFDDKAFLDNLFNPDPHEIWMRSLISLAFTGFGWLGQRSLNQQREFQESLNRKRDRLHQIIDSAYDAYIGMDEHGYVIAWNRSAEGLFGWTANEAMGQPLADMIIPEHLRDAHHKGLKAYLESSVGPWLYKPVYTSAKHRDGTAIVVEMVVSPLKSGDSQEFFAFIRKK